MLQPASTTFFRHLFTALFLSTQSTSPALLRSSTSMATGQRRDRQAVEAVFAKVALGGSAGLTRGIRGFLESELASTEDEALDWACSVACDVLEQRR
jgi:hypothetical protein